MRQVMPHRNNIDVRCTKCKPFFACGARNRGFPRAEPAALRGQNVSRALFPFEINNMLRIFGSTAVVDAAKSAWEPCDFVGDGA